MKMKYRKKPVVIEAVQYKNGNREEIIDFTNGTAKFFTRSHGLTIPTLEGEHVASPGDWIIKGIKGEFYPCKPDIFEATYDEVKEE